KVEQDRRRAAARNAGMGSIALGFIILFGVYYYLERQIGRRQRSEARLLHLNRLYAFLSQSNQAIVRVRTRDELFREICRAAVEYGQFAMAWIGFPGPDNIIQPVASAGAEDGYLQFVRLDAADEQTPEAAAGS